MKFNRTQKFTKENIGDVPKDKAIVYKIKNASTENLYTGVASRGRVQERLMEHKILKNEIIPGGTRFQFAQVKNKSRAEQIEKRIIKEEHPRFNKQNK